MTKTAILIDDEPGVVMALKLLMQTLGLQVEAFTEPQKALDFIKSIDLNNLNIDNFFVLSDLRMPVLNGFAVVEQCQSFLPQLKVILMSGHAEDEEIAKALSMGAKSFLSKPFSPQDLLKAIE